MTARDLFALTVGATLVMSQATQPKAVTSKSAPKRNTVVATPEAHTPQKRGPKPLNDTTKSALRDAIYARYMPTWRVADAEGITGKAHYQAECDANGIVTRKTVKV